MGLGYAPEEYGLEVIGELDAGGSYEFDLFTVWRVKDTGKIVYATDSG